MILMMVAVDTAGLVATRIARAALTALIPQHLIAAPTHVRNVDAQNRSHDSE